MFVQLLTETWEISGVSFVSVRKILLIPLQVKHETTNLFFHINYSYYKITEKYNSHCRMSLIDLEDHYNGVIIAGWIVFIFSRI